MTAKERELVTLAHVTYERKDGRWFMDLGTSVHRLVGFEAAALDEIAALRAERDAAITAREAAEAVVDAAVAYIGPHVDHALWGYNGTPYSALHNAVRALRALTTPTEHTP